jgi:hypothetical protein
MRNYTLAIVAGMGLFVPCVLQAAETDPATEDYASLFNGKDLNGWVTVGTPDSFAVEDNAIRTTGAHPYPSWLRTEKEYENFVLRFSCRTGGWYEGGVLLHAPQEGPGSKIGFKIHLRHNQKAYGLRSPGAIYDAAAPLAFPGRPPGQWNRCEVLCDWPVLRVTLNGTLIHDIDMRKNDALKHRLRRGFIGIQNICNSSALYKDIQIRPLPDKEKWTDLFASGLEGLRLEGRSEWSVEGETLTARGNNAMAYTKGEFSSPFELQVWVKTMVNGNGGVTFNSGKSNRHGVEVQCFNVPDSTNPTGSLYGISTAKRVVSRDQEWFLMQIFNDGSHAKVLVNGEKVSATDALQPPYQGSIGFQQHTPKGVVHYRGARIRVE